MKYQVRVKGRVNGHEVDTRFHMSANKKADEIKTKIKKITGVDRKCMVLEVKAPHMAPVRVTCIGDDAWTVGDCAAYGTGPIMVRLSPSRHGF